MKCQTPQCDRPPTVLKKINRLSLSLCAECRAQRNRKFGANRMKARRRASGQAERSVENPIKVERALNAITTRKRWYRWQAA